MRRDEARSARIVISTGIAGIWRRAAWVEGARAVGLIAMILATTACPGAQGTDAVAGSEDGAADRIDLLDLLVVGDLTIRPSLLSAAAARGWRAEVLGAIGCGVLPSSGKRFATGYVLDLAHCPKEISAWHDRVATVRPGLVLVYENHSGAAAQQVEGRWRAPCATEYEDAYAAALTETVQAFSAHGTRTVLMHSVPPSVPDLRRLREQFEGQTEEEVAAYLLEQTECLNRARSRASMSTGAPLIDLRELACPDDVCLREIDGVVLRADGIHFKNGGADRVASWLLDQLEALHRSEH